MQRRYSGDFIGRSLDRLKGNRKACAAERYNGIFEPKPDLVFIFLGANDTKAGSGSSFEKVTAEEKIDIIDAYTATVTHPDSRSLFISSDGIHMPMAGHRLIAGLVLDYLKARY